MLYVMVVGEKIHIVKVKEGKEMMQVFYFKRFKCDCGNRMEIAYETKKQLAEILKEEGWQRKGKKWLCKDCQPAKGKK